ncbi:MAG TPA: response regulator [Sphingomonas sp.]|nr:response regulator [Sphingomonas sp.]
MTAPNVRILVVDDDERNLLALSELLNPIADVSTVSSGRDALRLLLREDFAVILLDVFMPGLDGYETASLIRNRQQTARIPIIFLSAVNKETEHLMRGYEMGAVDYVFKPVDPLVLQSKVSVFVDLYRMRRQVEEQGRAEQALREAHYREQLGRMEVERQLEDSERRQASILRALPLAIYEAESDGEDMLRRRFVGSDISQFLGPAAAEPISGGRDWEDWIHPEDRRQLAAPSSRSGELTTAEFRWVGPDGVVRHLLDQRVEIDPHEGRRRWAGTLLDVTDRKRLEAQLVHVGKLDALGQLTGGVAHDFNNLLAAILGGIHVLERRLSLGEREQRIVDQMRHAADHGAELVRRMMAFARQQDLTPSSIDPAALCDSVAGLVNHTLGGTVTINWRCPDRRLNLFVDRGQLELALMNLILNARDAMPDGGEIVVSIEAISGTAVGNRALRVRVVDRGMGIPPDRIAKVTEPFFTTKETGKGTGLGLSMVAGFVHQSGGELHIDSDMNTGTTIDMILPATDMRACGLQVDTAEASAWLANKRMMLIDDDNAVRVVLTEQFRDAGSIVDEVASGEEAIKLIAAHPERYDYVLSDFAMPGLDGFETLRRARKLAPTAKFVLMTGYAEEFRLIGKKDFPVIRKPVDIGQLSKAFS